MRVDANRFDRLATTLGRGGSRRRLLAALVGGALIGLSDLEQAGATRTSPRKNHCSPGRRHGCPAGQACVRRTGRWTCEPDSWTCEVSDVPSGTTIARTVTCFGCGEGFKCEFLCRIGEPCPGIDFCLELLPPCPESGDPTAVR
jgi:hypothetical protein